MKKIIILFCWCVSIQAADIKQEANQATILSKLNNKLIAASSNNDVVRIAKLLQAGAQVHYVNHEDLTPLHVAAKKGNKEAVIELLKAKANINAKNQDGISPLHEAAAGNKNEYGGAYVIPVLVEAGADIAAQDNLYRTPLQIAVRNKYIDGIRALIVSVSPGELKLGLPRVTEKKIELARAYLPMLQEQQSVDETDLRKEIEASFKRVRNHK